MRFEDSFLSAPKNHEVTIRHQAIGVNFLDIIHRQGRIDIAKPFILGVEGSGFVERVGKSVKGFKIGDRVAYAALPSGSYSECRNIDSLQVIKLPRFISFENAAAIMLKGLTAEYLLHQTYRISRGTTILIHAAAGAMGLILSQWAKKIGATVIGVGSARKKKELALKNGCDHVIFIRTEASLKKFWQSPRTMAWMLFTMVLERILFEGQLLVLLLWVIWFLLVKYLDRFKEST